MRRAALTAALAVSTGVIAACSGGAPSPDRISVSNGGCGSSWQLPDPGWHTFQIHNAAAENADVDLLAPARQYHDWVAAGLNTVCAAPRAARAP